MSDLDRLLQDAKEQLGEVLGAIGAIVLGNFDKLGELESLGQSYIVAQAEYSAAYARWLSQDPSVT